MFQHRVQIVYDNETVGHNEIFLCARDILLDVSLIVLALLQISAAKNISYTLVYVFIMARAGQ